MRRWPAHAAAACLIAAIASPGRAADCSLEVTPLVFGRIDAITQRTATITADLRVSCTATVSETVSYDLVLMTPATSGAGGGRAMAGPRGALRYELFTSATQQQRWGGGGGGTAPVSGSMALMPGVRQTVVHTIFGRVLSRAQRPTSGQYSELLTVGFVQH